VSLSSAPLGEGLAAHALTLAAPARRQPSPTRRLSRRGPRQDVRCNAERMDIGFAGRPEIVDGPDAGEIAVKIPLTAPPDELLLESLEHSPQIASFCDKLEPVGHGLVLHPKDGGPGGLGTMLTAVQSLLALTNSERAAQAMSEEEMQARAAEARRREADDELQAWWDQQT
jgi:hypothetical protein